MPPRALLLDFDGVVADTENHHVAAWQRTFSRLGWEIPDDVCARAAEVDDRVFLAEVFAARKVDDGDIDGWVRLKQKLTLALLEDSPRIYPGIPALVDRVKKLHTVKLAVVTGTWRANAVTVLTSSGLYPSISLVVAKEDVSSVKPDPEAYLTAVKGLGISASEAVAIEDSPSGVASARQAGVRTLAVGHRRSRGPWSADSAYVADLRNTTEVLRLLGFDDGRPD